MLRASCVRRCAAAAADALLRERPGPGIVRFTLNKPQKRNALSSDLLRRLYQGLSECKDDPTARVVVIASRGPVFSSGHDLKELAALDQKGQLAVFQACSDLMQLVQSHMPQVVMAEVQGLATAAGCQLVAACDLAVASTSASFATPGVDIGLFCHTPAVPIARAVQRKHAMRMLVTGELIGARDAESWGLVSHVVDDSEDPADVRQQGGGALRSFSASIAEKIASKPSATITHGKRVLDRQLSVPLPDAYTIASEAMCTGLHAPDAKEGIGSFLQKKRPQWPSNRD
eukprot:TRINITY_DN39151_c0_g1_i1.p1 TRINITY_DN39151_c0_g1~~TRINITY_DN39151_c0_g1_i1.p1  ORF type:complete len:287 (+),score=79.53 TRINITY_DN39151_c0_g1_i1:46-906(+)